MGHRLRLFLQHWRYIKPSLNGAALQALGITPGPTMGELLLLIRAARLDGGVKSRDQEVALVRRWQQEGP